MKQGTRANYTGSELENFIDNVIIRRGYTFVEKKRFETAKYLGQPVYSKQYPISKSIYNTQLYCDFIIHHPEKHPDCLVIEAKWQQSAGSVDEKFPYLVENIRKKYPCATVIILAGGGYKKDAEQWLRNQVDEKLIHVLDMTEFQKWANNDGI